ncbi:putative nuclease HARBI1 [Acipenser ruthenus]|uniref:Putative nuclease HARBI1 n=1 Tax=Acipenser ruthenus TaxID=7906 RepID=A0A444U1Y1_ACIRT|nr:putative nuclease HARBI1 [Acipenser ruthenus]
MGEMSGDSGYGLKPMLMTPIANPATPQQRKYNKIHCSTRSTIERAFGILKVRFRCLDLTGGTLQYSPQGVCRLIVLCCMLHNTAIARSLPVYNDEGNVIETNSAPNDDDCGDEDEQLLDQNLPSGHDIRDNLILNVFA